MKKTLLILLLFAVFNTKAQALDPTFGTNGIVTNQFSNYPPNDYVNGGVMQADGKIVLVSGYKVSRFTSDGLLDLTFNSYGFKELPIQLRCIVMQPDGKIVVAGLTYIYRLNTDGSIDSTFDLEGVASIAIGSYNMAIRSMVMSGNKILLAGYVSNGPNNDFALVRLNPDGSFDTSFDVDGKATLDVGNMNNEGFAMALQPDGKILITGQAFDGVRITFATSRFTSTGSPDATFGTNGSVITSFTTAGRAQSVQLQSDGKIIVTGMYNSNKMAVIRYLANGSLDTSFNATGMLLTNLAYNVDTLLSGALSRRPQTKCLSNGKILISTGDVSNFLLYQLNTDGSMDSSFGINGIASLSINTPDYSAFLILKPDGKIITGGSSASTAARIELLQFSSDGVLEWEQNHNLILGNDKINKLMLQSSGKTITGSDDKISRFNIDGSLDTSFGINGHIDAEGYCYATQPDDKIIFAHYFSSLSRLTVNGNIDVSFGVNGTVDLQTILTSLDYIDNLYACADGKIYVVFDYLYEPTYTATHYGIMRLLNNGSVDTTFGVNGIQSISFDYYATAEAEYPQGLIVLADQKIIITGGLFQLNTSNGVVGTTRLLSNGAIDTSFGTNGKVITQTGPYNYSMSITMATNNKYLINYNGHLNGFTSQTTLALYNNNGTLDTTFGINGFLADQNNYQSILVQTDGKILRGGSINNQFGVNRTNSDGTNDSSFGSAGFLATPISYYSQIKQMVFQNGKLLAGGYSFNGTYNTFAQARYDLILSANDFSTVKNDIAIYPNPTADVLHIDSPGIDKIVITDCQGKKIIERTANLAVINVERLNSGVYFIRIEGKDGVTVRKFIKQ